MNIYDRATRAVPADNNEKYEMFLIYIKKVEEFYGITRPREIYEKAVAELPEEQVRMKLSSILCAGNSAL